MATRPGGRPRDGCCGCPRTALGEMAQAWFPFGVHLIKGLVQTVRNIESTARQREALVALGTLAAGLAHEINNPASAATRAVDALQRHRRRPARPRCAASPRPASPPEQYVELDALRQSLQPVPDPAESPLGAGRPGGRAVRLARRARRQPRTGWSPRRSPPAGADAAWCERVADAGRRRLPWTRALHWVANSLSAAALLGEIKESTQRVSNLVAAVRSYSQLDRASVQRTDVTEGLREHADGARPQAVRRHRGPRARRRPRDRGDPRRAQPGVDQPDRQRHRRDGRRRHAARLGLGHGPATWSSRSPTPGPASPPTCSRTSSSRSSRPRTSGRAPASGWTSRGGSSSTATAATSPSTRVGDETVFRVSLPLSR